MVRDLSWMRAQSEIHEYAFQNWDVNYLYNIYTMLINKYVYL